MSYNRENFKLSFKGERVANDGNENVKYRVTDSLNDTQFFVNEKKGTVVCVLEGYLNVPTTANDTLYLPERIFKGVGVAKCAQDDVFDVERGKRIALAKAENRVYISAVRYIEDTVAKISNIADAFVLFSSKAYHTCAHNEDYISSLSYEAHPHYKKDLKPLKRGK